MKFKKWRHPDDKLYRKLKWLGFRLFWLNLFVKYEKRPIVDPVDLKDPFRNLRSVDEKRTPKWVIRQRNEIVSKRLQIHSEIANRQYKRSQRISPETWYKRFGASMR